MHFIHNVYERKREKNMFVCAEIYVYSVHSVSVRMCGLSFQSKPKYILVKYEFVQLFCHFINCSSNQLYSDFIFYYIKITFILVWGVPYISFWESYLHMNTFVPAHCDPITKKKPGLGVIKCNNQAFRYAKEKRHLVV